MAGVNVVQSSARWGVPLRVSAITFLLGCSVAHGQDAPVDGDQPVESCSMINLIATPDDYDGKRIETQGVARMEFEGTAIYTSPESAKHRVKVNGIYLALGDSEVSKSSREHLDGKWVFVVGVYHKPERGSVDWRGHIDQITHLYAPEDVEME